MNTNPHLTSFAISKLIAKDLIDIWKAFNSCFPLLNEMTTVIQVNVIYFQKVKQMQNFSLLPK